MMKVLCCLFILSVASSCAQKKGKDEPAPVVRHEENPPDEKMESWLSRYDLDAKDPNAFKLPRRLSEASGLAVSDDGRLFSHDDERGVVYQVDHTTGNIVKQFSVGAFEISGDFEGIAVKGDSIFLVTSSGQIFAFREAEDGKRVRYELLRTRLSTKYDVEGLEYDPETDCLLLACKGYAGKNYEGKYKAVYAYFLKTRELLHEPRLLIPLDEVRKKAHKGDFNPSGIALHPKSGTFFIISADGESIIEIARDGKVLDQKELRKKVNSQPEGIAFTPDLTLIICNDGQGGRGTLTMYPIRK